MASATASGLRPAPKRRRVHRGWVAAGLLVFALVALGAAAFVESKVKLGHDDTALARVETGLVAGRVESARVLDARGREIPSTLRDGRLTPRPGVVAPGQHLTVSVEVRRPGATAWLLGHSKRERLALTAASPTLRSNRLTVDRGAPLRIAFDQPVHRVAYGTTRRTLGPGRDTVSLARHAVAGTMTVAATSRSWERLGTPQRVTWFPATASAALVTSPAPSGRITPTTPLRLAFSKKVDDAVGSDHPKLTPSVPGSWKKADDYTLEFHPTGAGAPLGAHVRVDLPRSVTLVDGAGALRRTKSVQWTVPPGSTLRLQQLLAAQGYFPLDWRPTGAPAGASLSAQVAAAVRPPAGNFTWRWGNVPSELRGMWQPGKPNDITRGAIMAFQNDHGLQADGFAGPQLWKAILADATKGKRVSRGYSYVYVHRDGSPQTATLWHNGKTVITSPGNTGVAAAPTELGTFPVFEHLRVTTMTGTNPGGGHYSDPGIKWVSYFNGGDALHAFDRASFGTPQSVGCVELPEAAAAKIWPYTPIGTLVTIEH
jgi:peptidoglycan hydrolase-like protein with peptidoglycan-binding domain